MHRSPNERPQTQGRKKVKTGCKTCKARRVKCDESRPACHRCVSTGRVCNGYGIWGGGDNHSQTQCSNALSIHCTPVLVGSFTSDEKCSFDWFREKTTRQFAGIFSSDFWETLVFQASAQEPAVRHAVLALSAAHRFDSMRGLWSTVVAASQEVPAEQFMLQHYNKAIHHLRSTPTGKNNKTNIRVTLIACLIFVSLEYLRGQYKSGSSHLLYGIQLLSAISTRAPRIQTQSVLLPSQSTPTEDFADDALIDSYARLTIQSAMFGIVPSHKCVMAYPTQRNTPPHSFKSIVEARKTLDGLLNKVKCFKEGYSNAKELGTLIDPAETLTIQAKIKKDLFLWRQAYDTRLECIEGGMNLRDSAGSIVLKLYHEMATVMAAVSLAESEMAFDQYTENFTAILKGFLELQNIWSQSNTERSRSNIEEGLNNAATAGNGFTIESGYIPPLYYTAIKCRIPMIRRQATQALRSMQHSEGLWNGILLADVLEEVFSIEESNPHVERWQCDAPSQNGESMVNDLSMPNVKEISRLSDVRVLLPGTMDGTHVETYITYKKMMADGSWATLPRKVGSRVS